MCYNNIMINGKTIELFPINVYDGEISEATHNATMNKLKNVQWDYPVEHSSEAHKMNISDNGTANFQSDVISQFELTEFADELIKHIEEYSKSIGSYIGNFSRTSWITKYEKGDYAQQHSHGSASISVAYYIASNGKDGDFYFSSPGQQKFTANTSHLPNIVRIPPKERKLLLFPSWLEHGVFKNKTENIRKCLSANIYF
jgi:uncharacterized protein (TIGR02466 family)